MIWEDFDVKTLLEFENVSNELLVACLSFIWVTARPPQVVHTDLGLVDNEEVPKVLDERLGEECFAFSDVIFFENFVAGKLNFLEIKFQLFTESLLISLLLCNCREKQKHHHVERFEVHVAFGELEHVHELPDLSAHPLGGPVVAAFR